MFNADKARKLVKKHRAKMRSGLSWEEKLDCYLQVRKVCRVMRSLASEGYTRWSFDVEKNRVTDAVAKRLQELGFECSIENNPYSWYWRLYVSFKEESND